jgi:DNA-binding IclR family transcriptional regulator
MTENSITAVAELKAQLAEIRASGVATEYCESNEAAACVAAAVRDSSGAVLAAMSISAPTMRWDDDAKERFTVQVTEGARVLSGCLGYRYR